MTIVLTSTQLNRLIYYYLEELGFQHTAYVLEQEGQLALNEDPSSSKCTLIPPSLLVKLVQKGILLSKLEHHLNEDGTERECATPWSVFDFRHECTTPSIISKSITAQNMNMEEDIPSGTSNSIIDSLLSTSTTSAITSSSAVSTRKKRKASIATIDSSKKMEISNVGNGNSSAIINRKTSLSFENVNILSGHQSEIITLYWNPRKDDTLASASGDGTARIWKFPSSPLSSSLSFSDDNVLILDHRKSQNDNDSKGNENVINGKSGGDVTCLDWHPDGLLLSTGCYDGKSRIWSVDSGQLLQVQSMHQGPIFAMKWSPKGDWLASVGVDQTLQLYNHTDSKMNKTYKDHSAPSLDVDWRTDWSLASCSTDQTIRIYNLSQSIINDNDDSFDVNNDGNDVNEKKNQRQRQYDIGDTVPSFSDNRILQGHQDEVNSIKWNSDGRLLASCSDDRTARIWSCTDWDDLQSLVQCTVLEEHTQEIYTCKWNSQNSVILATASFDNTVRIWDAITGKRLNVLTKHTKPVYAISFSPDGKYLASGSLDEHLMIWSVKDGKLIRSFGKGDGGIFEVSWNNRGDQIAACTSAGNICVLQFQ